MSVLSATGSLEISGASRCDDIQLPHWLERSCRGGWRAGSADRPGDPGGQVLVAQPGLAGPGEHLDVPRLGVADVHHDRAGVRAGLAMALRLIRCRRPAGGGQGRARGRTYGGGGQTRGAGRRGPLKQGTPGKPALRRARRPDRSRIRGTLRILTGHDNPFGGWPFRWLAFSVAGLFGGWPFRWLAFSVAGLFGGWVNASVAGEPVMPMSGQGAGT